MQNTPAVYKLGLSRLLKVIRRTRALRGHEKWSREELRALTRKLDAFQPHVLGGYATNVQLLALEQLAGRLEVNPQMVLSTAETLKKEARAAIEKAWGAQPCDAYRGNGNRRGRVGMRGASWDACLRGRSHSRSRR